ncbi:MAG: (d)CMP kinase [Coriobacteriales bacterium]|jgi:cytidylate kinase|nr:(d)CMP kinase [Coriobacteriales bacterium]
MIIAIDGPAASGKSTVAKLVARKLGFAYLDTGAMYRSVAWRALEEGLALGDPLPAATKTRIAQIATNEPITFGYLSGEPLPSQVFIDGVDVTTNIRTPEADKAVSPVSADPGVRAALTEQQRIIGRTQDTVMEGRDIGTIVFPDAELKVFLTATAEERARRRYQQNVKKAEKASTLYTGLDEAGILADIHRRDAYDSSREVAPLMQAPDAVEIDTTTMSINAVVKAIAKLVESSTDQSAKLVENSTDQSAKLVESSACQSANSSETHRA